MTVSDILSSFKTNFSSLSEKLCFGPLVQEETIVESKPINNPTCRTNPLFPVCVFISLSFMWYIPADLVTAMSFSF